MKNISKIEKYRLITEFICYNYSTFMDRQGIVLKENFVKDISFFNQIVGRMENYLTDKGDMENFNLMCEYFHNEMDRRCYSNEDFEDFVNNQSVQESSDAE